MTYTIEAKTVAAQPTLFVRGATTIPQIARSIGEFLHAVGDHLREHGIEPAASTVHVGPYWEIHLNDPTKVSGPHEYQTEVVLPLAQ